MIEPGASLGVLGGGQLGRMFTLRARAMGYRVVVLEPDPRSPAGAAADRHIVAPYDDPAALTELAESCDAITIEFENVPADALRTLALVRAARGELARARALEVEATALEPQAPPDALARLGEAWTRDALGFPIGTEDVGKSLLASGPFADAVRNLAARVPRAVAVQRPKR